MPRTLSPGFARIFAALSLVCCVAMLSLPAAAAPTFTILHAFSGLGTDGAQPQGGLLQDIGGNIHGETQLGGFNGLGSNYVVSSTGSKFMTLYSFSPASNPNDGQAPIGGLRNLVGDAQVTGIDFGVTNAGGAYGFGTVFISDQLGNEITIHNFTGGNDGFYPVGRLLPWVDGNYYGTALDGGKYGYGVVFRIAGNGAFKVLHAFDLSDGAGPQGGLQYGNDGNFYGTTNGGGADNEGVAYRISPGGSYKVIYTFTGLGDGGAPYGDLASDFLGNLYGTTSGGGTGGAGTVFRVTQAGAFSLLYTFPTAGDGSNPKGAFPYASLTIGSTECSLDMFVGPTRVRANLLRRATSHIDGGSSAVTLYGTTTLGGNTTNSGVVFSLNTSSHAYSIIYAFSGTDGSTPEGKLLGSFDGNLYGTTSSGGPNGNGEVFKIGGVLPASAVHSTFQGFHPIR